MNEIFDELYFAEQCVLNSVEEPRKVWKECLGDLYEIDYVRAIVDGWIVCREAVTAAKAAVPASHDWLNYVLAAPQIEQRTDAWYEQAKRLLTASEIWTITKSTRERGLLVMTKAGLHPKASGGKNLCVASEFMSAFDWGIRFEPVIKSIYEHKYKVNVKDVGRIIHRDDKRVAASPDGIVIDKVMPRLLEIKCPVSRNIGGAIPPEYYAQMQVQMEVTGAPCCDYVEAKIRSVYKNSAVLGEGPALGSGLVWRVMKESDDMQREYYVYDKFTFMGVECIVDGAPKDGEIVVERIEWDLMGWHEVRVMRDKAWWSNMLVKINEFWKDVEAAKDGKFAVAEPVVSRKRKRHDDVPDGCMITFGGDGDGGGSGDGDNT